MANIWFRAYRAFRIRVLRESPILHETFEEMVARQSEFYSRPEVIARLQALPVTHTYDRATGKLAPVQAKP